jgi:hypothetical protein
MSSKLTKAFAGFVGEMGFEIAKDETSQQPGEDLEVGWAGASLNDGMI